MQYEKYKIYKPQPYNSRTWILWLLQRLYVPSYNSRLFSTVQAFVYKHLVLTCSSQKDQVLVTCIGVYYRAIGKDGLDLKPL